MINTGGGDYFPLYEVLFSNDNSTWDNVCNKTYNSYPSVMMSSFKTPKKIGRYIKLHGIGQRYDGGLRMAIYGLDFFGRLFGVSPIRQSCQIRRKGSFLCFIFCEIIL